MESLAFHRQKYIVYGGITTYRQGDSIDAPEYIPLGCARAAGLDDVYGQPTLMGGFKSREALAESYHWATVDAETVAASMAG